MYKDIAPHLPNVVLLNSPPGLEDFQKSIESLDILGIEIAVATADILDQLRVREQGLYNLAVSSNEMRSDEVLISELGNDIDVYVCARDVYGISLFKQLVQHGLYVNGVLYYQLRYINSNTLTLEKLLIPLTEYESQPNTTTRQLDLTYRRAISDINKRIARIGVY